MEPEVLVLEVVPFSRPISAKPFFLINIPEAVEAFWVFGTLRDGRVSREAIPANFRLGPLMRNHPSEENCRVSREVGSAIVILLNQLHQEQLINWDGPFLNILARLVA